MKEEFEFTGQSCRMKCGDHPPNCKPTLHGFYFFAICWRGIGFGHQYKQVGHCNIITTKTNERLAGFPRGEDL